MAGEGRGITLSRRAAALGLAACNNPDRTGLALRLADMNRFRSTRTPPPCALADDTPVHQIQRWRIDDPKDRPAILNQRDVDGELAITGDKLFCSVQRIDQPEPAVRFPVNQGGSVLL